MVGLAQLQHHVVGDVDDGVDRAHPRTLQALHKPGGRGAHREAVEHPEAEAEAQVTVVDPDRGPLGGGGGALGHGGGRDGEGHLEPGRQVTGDADDRQGVGPVALDVEVEQHVGVGPQGIGQGLARLFRLASPHGVWLDQPGALDEQLDPAHRS